jgi:hypothetical protein
MGTGIGCGGRRVERESGGLGFTRQRPKVSDRGSLELASTSIHSTSTTHKPHRISSLVHQSNAVVTWPIRNHHRQEEEEEEEEQLEAEPAEARREEEDRTPFGVVGGEGREVALEEETEVVGGGEGALGVEGGEDEGATKRARRGVAGSRLGRVETLARMLTWAKVRRLLLAPLDLMLVRVDGSNRGRLKLTFWLACVPFLPWLDIHQTIT